ncbi:MAG: insulinase family protein [Actinomycetia bacterium]|nr:insulinase family protein [Actinomycetes bacterium]
MTRSGSTSGLAGPRSPEGGDAVGVSLGRDSAIEVTHLDDGPVVVTETVPGSGSVSLGFWFAVGSRDEDPEAAGASHFLEHLLFKGTPDRRARDIAETVDAVGGDMNAFTGREYTAYYARLPAQELDLGLDILVDVTTRPAFRPHDVEAERQVILEELLMDEDLPDDLTMTLLQDALFPDHGLGREVVGDKPTLEVMTRDQIADFHQRWYTPANLVVAAAGGVEHDELLRAVRRHHVGIQPGPQPDRQQPVVAPRARASAHRPFEQVHLALGWRALPIGHPDRYALAVLNQVLGGGLSSRMFQEIREERGMAYTVYSSVSAYSDAGSALAYVATSPRRAPEALSLLNSIVDDLASGGITDRELEIARGYLEGSLVLGLEDNASRMSRIGSNVTVRGTVIPIDDHVEAIRAVDRAAVERIAAELFAAAPAIAVVGPADPTDLA